MLLLKFLGGFIYHFFHDPLPLELTMDYPIFTGYDDSEEKLTLETFGLISIVLVFGWILGLITLLLEIYTHKKKMVKLAKLRKVNKIKEIGRVMKTKRIMRNEFD